MEVKTTDSDEPVADMDRDELETIYNAIEHGDEDDIQQAAEITEEALEKLEAMTGDS